MVACRMPVRIVNRLEVVDVEYAQCERMLMGIFLHEMVEIASVLYTRQMVFVQTFFIRKIMTISAVFLKISCEEAFYKRRIFSH